MFWIIWGFFFFYHEMLDKKRRWPELYSVLLGIFVHRLLWCDHPCKLIRKTNTKSANFSVYFPINVYCCGLISTSSWMIVLWILGLSLMFCLPQSVICKQWKRWMWRNIALMVKGIIGTAVVINSSFLCCTLISFREFQQGLSKQTWRLRSKGKPKGPTYYS